MSNKIKRKRYSRSELEEARRTCNGEIIGELAGNLMNGIPMSMVEEEFASSVLRATKPEDSICFVDLASIPAAQNFIFRKLYVAYFADLEGRYGIEKFDGLVSVEEKREDVIRLNEFYQAWKKIISRNNHNERLLNLVINETNRELKILKELLSSKKIIQVDYDYKEKAIVLHSKYIYIVAKTFFDEHESDEVIAKFQNKEIIIDEFSLIHILSRHLAGAAKQFDTMKSFHIDSDFKWFELPYDLKRIIEEIGTHTETNMIDLKFLPFKFNGVIYAFWVEQKIKYKKKEAIHFLRLQTCYPIKDESKLQKVQDYYREIPISNKLSGFVFR